MPSLGMRMKGMREKIAGRRIEPFSLHWQPKGNGLEGEEEIPQTRTRPHRPHPEAEGGPSTELLVRLRCPSF